MRIYKEDDGKHIYAALTKTFFINYNMMPIL